MTGELKAVLSHPAYSGVTYQDRVGGSTSFRSWEFNGWPQESLSWKQGCCLHAGLSGSGPLSIKGPGAKKYLESICINSFDNFPVGSMKHAVMCNEDGIIEAHGIIERLAEDHFTSYAGGPPSFDLSKVPPNVTSERLRWYLFQIAGPSSAALIEKLTGENLHDLKFLCQRNSKVLGKYLESGKDIQVEIARIGMARNLAYEFHGPMEEAAEVYDAVFKVGQEFGIERFGWNTYWVNHTEGGFPQISGHFTSPLQAKALPSLGGTSGSVDPQNMRARYRTPVEVGWGHLAKPHDYPGRKAVEAELANPKRTTVTLRWNAKDVGAVWNTWLKPGEEALPLLTMPHGPYRKNRGGHQDHILLNGREIGYSSGVIYSYYFREFLSFGCIDIEAAALGTEMSVLWGDYGRRMLGIRATVAELPYLSKGKFGQPDPQ